MALTAEQKHVLTTVLAVAHKVGATAKEKKAAVETAIVEANLGNPTRPGSGDGTSIGWRQETSSSYPGVDRGNVRQSAKRFFAETKQARDKYGKAGDLAQAVQRSAYPDRYRQHSGEAQQLIRKYDKGGGSASRGTKGTPSRVVSKTVTTPGVDRSEDRKALLGAYLTTRNQPNALLSLGSGLANAQDTPATSKTTSKRVAGPAKPASSSGDVKGHIELAPGADRAGVSTQKTTKTFVQLIAGRTHNTVTIGTGTNHSQMTVNGNVSDHWSGHAADIPVPVDSHQGNVIASAALQIAGVGKAQARAMVRKGGLWTLTPKSGPLKGKRVQVIWRTTEGGNHHNHVHVGVR